MARKPNIPRQLVPGREATTLSGAALQRDLDPKTQEEPTPIGVGADGPGLMVQDKAGAMRRVMKLIFGVGAVAFSTGNAASFTATVPVRRSVTLMAVGDAFPHEQVSKSVVRADLTGMAESRLSVSQDGTNGASVQAEYWDGAAWALLGPSVPLASTLPVHVSGWVALPTAARGDVAVRALVIGGVATTEIYNITLEARGNAPLA